jgi:hypothetical protein
MDIRGVFPLRSHIEAFLEKKGKDLLLARHMAEKQSYAVKIIAVALIAVVGQALIRAAQYLFPQPRQLP